MCALPSNLVVDSITHNTVAFSWNGNNSDFEVDLGVDGIPLGQGNIFSTVLDSLYQLILYYLQPHTVSTLEKFVVLVIPVLGLAIIIYNGLWITYP